MNGETAAARVETSGLAGGPSMRGLLGGPDHLGRIAEAAAEHLRTTIPNKIRVAGFDYTISRSSEVDSKARWAETEKNLKRIRFGVLAGGQQMSESFLHELMHAVWEEYGLASYLTDEEERVITALSSGLYQVLCDLDHWPREMHL